MKPTPPRAVVVHRTGHPAAPRAVQPKISGKPAAPRVPEPCGGRVGAPPVGAKSASGPQAPRVPEPCGGRVGAPAVQPKMAPPTTARWVPPPAGGRVGPPIIQPKMAAPPATGVVQRAAAARDPKADLEAQMEAAAAAENWDLYDALVEKAEAAHGKMGDASKGAALDADDDWIPSGIGVRPAKPGALWKQVYAGGTKVAASGLYLVNCKEAKHTPATVSIQMDGKSFKEVGVGKRPPVCHKIAYNHLYSAWKGIMSRPTYTGPQEGAAGFEAAHQDLAWGNLGNLQPGHTHCNSVTASAAKGAAPAGAVTYVEAWARGKGWL